MDRRRFKAAAVLGVGALSLLGVACGPNSSSTEQAGPAASSRKGGLGKAAANVPDEETTTTASAESTTSSESTTTAAATTPSIVTSVVTVTQAPQVTQAPVTQATPAPTQVITQPQPQQPSGPSESPPRLSANGSAQCPAGKATINWTGTNLSAVTITFNGANVGGGGGSGSTTVSYTCGTQARYNLAGSNSAGSATAYVDVFST